MIMVLAVVFGIVAVAVVANFRQKRSNEKYEKYRTELAKVRVNSFKRK